MPFLVAMTEQRGPQRHTGARRRLRRPAQRLRIGLIQGVCAVAGLLLALVAVRIDLTPVFPATTTAPVMLTIAFSVVSLVTIIFSLLFTVVQWVYGTFSLRLRRFEDHPMTWWVFGTAIGTFVYSLTATLLSARNESVSWVVPGVTFLLTLVALVMMRQVQLAAFTSVQLGPTLQELCVEGLDVAAKTFPDPFDATSRPLTPHHEGQPTSIRWDHAPCVLQQIDESALVAEAARNEAFIRISLPVGAPVAPGTVVAHVWGSTQVDLGQVLITGSSRTRAQDPLLPLRVMADIALKALSPAVNDPATAVQAMDALSPVLTSLATRNLDIGLLADGSGRVVAELVVPTWEVILAESLDDLVVCAAPLPLSARRLRALLTDLEAASPVERRPAVRRRLERLEVRVGAT